MYARVVIDLAAPIISASVGGEGRTKPGPYNEAIHRQEYAARTVENSQHPVHCVPKDRDRPADNRRPVARSRPWPYLVGDRPTASQTNCANS